MAKQGRLAMALTGGEDEAARSDKWHGGSLGHWIGDCAGQGGSLSEGQLSMRKKWR
jgi:hypothetical protein